MNNPPAFPSLYSLPETQGMLLRDYFAAKAMQGFQEQWVYDNSDEIANKAYAMADAMLKAREA